MGTNICRPKIKETFWVLSSHFQGIRMCWIDKTVSMVSVLFFPLVTPVLERNWWVTRSVMKRVRFWRLLFSILWLFDVANFHHYYYYGQYFCYWWVIIKFFHCYGWNGKYTRENSCFKFIALKGDWHYIWEWPDVGNIFIASRTLVSNSV